MEESKYYEQEFELKELKFKFNKINPPLMMTMASYYRKGLTGDDKALMFVFEKMFENTLYYAGDGNWYPIKDENTNNYRIKGFVDDVVFQQQIINNFSNRVFNPLFFQSKTSMKDLKELKEDTQKE